MNKITKTFTYDLPDDYLSTERTQDNTGPHTYTGPDKIWVFVNKETLKWQQGRYLTEDNDGADYPTPLDCHKVMIDCATDPLMCHIFGADEARYHYGSQPTVTETLPDGEVYTRIADIPPDHTHDFETVTYDPVTNTWTTPWREPHVTWADVRIHRNGLLLATDHSAPDDAPAARRVAFETYRQKLRDMPQVHGATNTTKTIDLTATAPINQAGQLVIQLTDITDIEIGFDVGMTVHGMTNIFSNNTTTVVSIDSGKKQITLSDPLRATPSSVNGNTQLNFSPEPDTAPWKIQTYQDPDNIYHKAQIDPEPLAAPDDNHPV